MTIQNRPDSRAKLDKFMTAAAIAHCAPSDNDWLVTFNNHSEAIAASEPCEGGDEAISVDDVQIVSMITPLGNRWLRSQEFLNRPLRPKPFLPRGGPGFK